MQYHDSSFMMNECPAYFEAYSHVLKSLQRMNKWIGIPFQEQIVHGKPAMKVPFYADRDEGEREKRL